MAGVPMPRRWTETGTMRERLRQRKDLRGHGQPDEEQVRRIKLRSRQIHGPTKTDVNVGTESNVQAESNVRRREMPVADF
jgi:hypothetical protein